MNEQVSDTFLTITEYMTLDGDVIVQSTEVKKL